MSITFIPLQKSHFSLCLKWLNSSHVKQGWDDVFWTLDLIDKKYNSYTKGYKIENGQKKPIKAYIICINNIPVGYIQIYNAYDFKRSYRLDNLPSSLAALDMYIGEKDYLGQGIGTHALCLFLQIHCDPLYTHVLVDPDPENKAAIRCYIKAGFKEKITDQNIKEIIMIKNCD